MKVGDQIIITWVKDSNHSYTEMKVGDKYKIIDIENQYFFVNFKSSIHTSASFDIDNIRNDLCKYKLITRKEKLERILK